MMHLLICVGTNMVYKLDRDLSFISLSKMGSRTRRRIKRLRKKKRNVHIKRVQRKRERLREEKRVNSDFRRFTNANGSFEFYSDMGSQNHAMSCLGTLISTSHMAAALQAFARYPEFLLHNTQGVYTKYKWDLHDGGFGRPHSWAFDDDTKHDCVFSDKKFGLACSRSAMCSFYTLAVLRFGHRPRERYSVEEIHALIMMIWDFYGNKGHILETRWRGFPFFKEVAFLRLESLPEIFARYGK